jgi:hypothetical protein
MYDETKGSLQKQKVSEFNIEKLGLVCNGAPKVAPKVRSLHSSLRK